MSKENLAEALSSLAGNAACFLARQPQQEKLAEYGGKFSGLLLDIGALVTTMGVSKNFQNPCCNKHYANGGYCSSSVSASHLNYPVFPSYSSLAGFGGIACPYPLPVVKIKSKHCFDAGDGYSSLKMRILPSQHSLSIRFRKWDQGHHLSPLPGNPFFWTLKSPKEIFEALAGHSANGRYPGYAASFFEELAYLPGALAILVNAAEPAEEAIGGIISAAKRLDEELR